MIWEKSELHADDVRELARRYNLDLISASVLLRRGFTAGEPLRFLLEDDLALLHNPFLFPEMGRAVARIRSAIEGGESIVVFGDRDVDGITSTILVYQLLQSRGAKVRWQIPLGEEDYGLSAAAVEQAAGEGCSLLITVDCGVSNVEEIARARELGMDTIVLDHHNPPESLPVTAAMLNPKCKDCPYPFRDLAGCGVALKLVLAMAMADTPLAGEPVWILHVRPANAAYLLEAVCLENLVPGERIADSLPPGMPGLEKSRVYRALAGKRVLVYDLPGQRRLLEEVSFDPGFELEDIAPWLQPWVSGGEDNGPAGAAPAGHDLAGQSLAGQSLLRIKESLPQFRYSPVDELGILVALYVSAMWSRYRLADALEPVLDLAALGTVADLMPVIDENKIIVRRGLALLARMRRPGLRELLIRQNLHGRRLTSKDLSWHVAPVLNSAGRMGEPERAAALLLAEDTREIEGLLDAVMALNVRRKQLGDRLWDACYGQAGRSAERAGGKLLLVRERQIPRGITGILAARLAAAFHVPALVVALGDTKAVGSLRSPYPVDGLLDQFAELLLNYGGHDRAAGFNLLSERFAEFEERFYRLAASYEAPPQEEARIRIDAEVPPEFLNPELIRVVELFEPYGEGFPPLTFLTRGLSVEGLEIVGRRERAHAKLLLRAGRHRWPALYWNAADKVGKEFSLQDTVDVVYRLGRNYFQNTETLQLSIVDLKR
ncbi:MAG: single-stranded-DNA-specific exonuclease RecJ [Spirochaetales bacterium]|nr:single-stranded-DNA-specific exonuclease RecJ [Spirochaetales bacterium]